MTVHTYIGKSMPELLHEIRRNPWPFATKQFQVDTHAASIAEKAEIRTYIDALMLRLSRNAKYHPITGFSVRDAIMDMWHSEDILPAPETGQNVFLF